MSEASGIEPVKAWTVAVLLWLAVFSIPSGLALDRVDNRHAIVGFALLFALTTVGAGLAAEAGAFWAVAALRFVGGCVTVFLWTAAVNVVGSAFTRGRSLDLRPRVRPQDVPRDADPQRVPPGAGEPLGVGRCGLCHPDGARAAFPLRPGTRRRERRRHGAFGSQRGRGRGRVRHADTDWRPPRGLNGP